jgi:hypothetical protein
VCTVYRVPCVPYMCTRYTARYNITALLTCMKRYITLSETVSGGVSALFFHGLPGGVFGT